MNSFFNNQQSLKDIELLYQQKLDELPVSYEFLKIETSFGDTSIILTGNEKKPPLVLLHASNGSAPIAIEAMIGLLNDFRVYAIDVVEKSNLEDEFQTNMKDDSYGQWMFEILTRLNVWNATLVGISFGGFIGWKTLVFDERRISRAFLIAPAGIVIRKPWRVFRKIILPMKCYQWLKKIKYIHQLSNQLFTELDEYSIPFLSKILVHTGMNFRSIPLISEQEAQKIKKPLYIIASVDDLLFPGKKILKRARIIFPSLVDILLLEKSKHIPDKSGYERIVEFINKHSN